MLLIAEVSYFLNTFLTLGFIVMKSLVNIDLRGLYITYILC